MAEIPSATGATGNRSSAGRTNRRRPRADPSCAAGRAAWRAEDAARSTPIHHRSSRLNTAIRRPDPAAGWSRSRASRDLVVARNHDKPQPAEITQLFLGQALRHRSVAGESLAGSTLFAAKAARAGEGSKVSEALAAADRLQQAADALAAAADDSLRAV